MNRNAYEKIDSTILLNFNERNLEFNIDKDEHIDCNDLDEAIDCLEELKCKTEAFDLIIKKEVKLEMINASLIYYNRRVLPQFKLTKKEQTLIRNAIKLIRGEDNA